MNRNLWVVLVAFCMALPTACVTYDDGGLGGDDLDWGTVADEPSGPCGLYGDNARLIQFDLTFGYSATSTMSLVGPQSVMEHDRALEVEGRISQLACSWTLGGVVFYEERPYQFDHYPPFPADFQGTIRYVGTGSAEGAVFGRSRANLSGEFDDARITSVTVESEPGQTCIGLQYGGTLRGEAHTLLRDSQTGVESEARDGSLDALAGAIAIQSVQHDPNVDGGWNLKLRGLTFCTGTPYDRLSEVTTIYGLKPHAGQERWTFEGEWYRATGSFGEESVRRARLDMAVVPRTLAYADH